VIFKRNTLQNFERFVAQQLNTGHSVIQSGYDSCGVRPSKRILYLWDKKIGTKDCSCRSKLAPEILLATSIISHEIEITGTDDFLEIYARIDHLTAFHNLSAVIGLGVNSVRRVQIDFDRLHSSVQNFLKYLFLNQVQIGCRGLDTLEFLIMNGFKRSNLFITGCPSLQLIKMDQNFIPKNISRILVSGSLINHLDLLESQTSNGSKFLVVPQTLDSYDNALRVQKSNSAIEIFTPASYSAWQAKLKSWGPEISMGTRLHGNIVAMSAGIPAVFMSGDTRTVEITKLLNLPFFDDLVSLPTALQRLQSISILDTAEAKSNLRDQTLRCIGSEECG
jgi:hypothetical protein